MHINICAAGLLIVRHCGICMAGILTSRHAWVEFILAWHEQAEFIQANMGNIRPAIGGLYSSWHMG